MAKVIRDKEEERLAYLDSCKYIVEFQRTVNGAWMVEGYYNDKERATYAFEKQANTQLANVRIVELEEGESWNTNNIT